MLTFHTEQVAGRVLMDFLQRADIMLYGDLTIRNYLNELYDLGRIEIPQTMLTTDDPLMTPSRLPGMTA